MAMAIDVQRLELGDVILIDVDGDGAEVEAKVVRSIDRTPTTVLVRLRVEERDDDFVREWPLDEQVVVVRGP